MNKVLKKFLCLVLALTVCSALISCGKPTESDNGIINITPDKNASGELSVACGTSINEQNIIKGVAKLFNITYPNIKVTLKPFSGEVAQTITQYFNAEKYKPGTMPDVFSLTSFDMLTLSDKRVIQNLDPYIDGEETAGTFNSNDYYKEFWILGQQNFNGKQLMIPRSADSVVCHYNKKIFKDAGINMTKIVNGWSWDDFRDVCSELRTYYDNHGMSNYYLIDSYLTWEAVYNAIFEACGTTFFNESGNFEIKKDAAKKALDLMKEMEDKRWIAPLSTASANFAGGQGCMMFHAQAASIMSKSILQTYPDVTDVSTVYDVVSFPLIKVNNSPKIGCGISGYSIYSGSKMKDYAWQFLKALLTKEGQNIIADEGGANVPPIRKDMADPKNPENHWGVGYEKINLEAYVWGSEYKCPTTFIAVKKPEYAKSLLDCVSQLVLNYVDVGDSFDDAVSACENKANAYLSF